MKSSFPLILLSVFWFQISAAQSFESGLALYESGDYTRALTIFEKSDDDKSLLFAGKGYFATGNYLKAINALEQARLSPSNEVKQEAGYTIALAHFQLKNFAKSLDVLYRIKTAPTATSVTEESALFYKQILGYLSPKQRFDAFKQTNIAQVRFDLLETAIGNVPYGSAVALLNAYKRSVNPASEPDITQIERELSDSISYNMHYNPNEFGEAPAGISYHVGVALPQFGYDAPEYEIAQNLYFGIQLAVEEFNTEHPDKKIFLTYKNTNESPDKTSIVNDLIWNFNVDAIIGPLFSETAQKFSLTAKENNIPVITPLANSDSLSLFQNTIFQINPNFALRGKKMAQYAVNVLKLDSIAVIAESDALGTPSAKAFKDEAELLGAAIAYYYVEDLENMGYDISEFTPDFEHVSAIYAPFTGSVASTLINSLLTDLEAMQSHVIILGSAEWKNEDLKDRHLSGISIYYTDSFEIKYGTSPVEKWINNFKLRFGTEPNRFAFIGYDTAKSLFTVCDKVHNPAYFIDGLKNLNNYYGLSTKISFNGGQVNQEVEIKSIPNY